MRDLDETTVRFRKPPVVETLQGVFFRPLPDFSVALLGVLWERFFRQEFPFIEEKACIEQVDEWFGDAPFPVPDVRWKVSDRPEAPRIWARSESGNHVLQIQRDAILTNWLKLGHDDQYSHYEMRRSDFEDKVNKIQKFFRDEGIGAFEPVNCLMTYVNHVPLDNLSDEPAVVEDVFSFWSNKTSFGWLPKPDQLTINVSYPMPNNIGRLHLRVLPAVHTRDDRQELVLRFELTARGRPRNQELDGLLAWLDLGHDWIVKGFADITRRVWHDKDKWERIT